MRSSGTRAVRSPSAARRVPSTSCPIGLLRNLASQTLVPKATTSPTPKTPKMIRSISPSWASTSWALMSTPTTMRTFPSFSTIGA
ncbi:hypothetical protein D3C86_960330 [compost metagenome]